VDYFLICPIYFFLPKPDFLAGIANASSLLFLKSSVYAHIVIKNFYNYIFRRIYSIWKYYEVSFTK
jgi:hypothetical protein